MGVVEIVKQLMRGRHHLTHEEVVTNQRRRMFTAFAKAMVKKGYVDTNVADIIKGARVSRRTFYQEFDSKQDCYLAALEALSERIVETLGAPVTGTPIERFSALLRSYLELMASDPASARLYLVEIHAVGPVAVQHRVDLQTAFDDRVAAVFGARKVADRFACKALVAAISTLVTHALVDGGADAVRALHTPLVRYARNVMQIPA